MAITATQRTDLVKVAVALFNAAPGANYLNDFSAYGSNVAGLVNDLAANPAFTSLYPAFLTSKEFGTQFVNALVGNAAAAEDKAWAADWIAAQLDAGMSRADAMIMAVTALQGATGDAKWGAAATQFANKVKVAEYYSVDLGLSQTEVRLLQSVIANVTDKTDVSDAAKIAAVINATSGGAGSVGQIFTLTAGNDYADGSGMFLAGGNFSSAGFKFTATNETVNSTQASLTAGDILVDGSTSDADTLNIVSSATLAGVTPATVTNIENVKITTSAAGGGALGMNNFTGVKTVTVSGTGSTAVALTSVATTGATTVDASGVTATAQGVTASFAASTSTADLTLKGGAGADILFGGIGADTITGGTGNDQLSGGSNADNIDGGAGNDLIDGGSGNDTLVGGAGTDVIVTSGGNDKVTAGGGNDLIVLATIAGSTFGVGDVITDSTGAANTAALEAGDTTTYANGQVTFNNLDNGEAPIDFVRTIVANDFTVITGTAALVATAAGSNTLVFADTAANNGADTVIGFALGATAAGGDVMDFSAFLGGAATSITINGQDGNADNVTAANVVVMTNNAAATDTIAWKASSNYVLVQDDGTNTTVSYVTTDGAGTVASTTTVATLTGLADVSAAVAANFA